MTKYQFLAAIVKHSVAEPRGICMPWEGRRTPLGYGVLTIKSKSVFAHRVALELHLGRPLAPGMFALHSCHNRPCVNVAHIYEGTFQDRIDKMVKAGRSTLGDKNGRRTKPECGPRGDRHFNSVKSHALRSNLPEMAAMVSGGRTFEDIASHYRVTYSTVRNWHHAYVTGHYKINPASGCAEVVGTKDERRLAWKKLKRAMK